jgi:hypothetical protein
MLENHWQPASLDECLEVPGLRGYILACGCGNFHWAAYRYDGGDFDADAPLAKGDAQTIEEAKAACQKALLLALSSRERAALKRWLATLC